MSSNAAMGFELNNYLLVDDKIDTVFTNKMLAIKNR